jgi:hypothetical protein
MRQRLVSHLTYANVMATFVALGGSVYATTTISGRQIKNNRWRSFSIPMRGSILRREGKPRAYSYRFSDPMIQPYVIMSSLTQSLITNQQLGKLRPARPEIEEPSETGRLF